MADRTSLTGPAAGSTRLSESIGGEYSCHVVLYQPQIPWNTGNVGRTCVAAGAKLWIVEPANFRLDDTSIRRAGLDYWQHVHHQCISDLDDLHAQLPRVRRWYFSRHARRSFWDVRFQRGDILVFGNETNGLPPSILGPAEDHALAVPMTGPIRCLNLSTTVGIVTYELLRQLNTQ